MVLLYSGRRCRACSAPLGLSSCVCLVWATDKSLAVLRQAEEHNAYLGIRGIRLSLRSPGLFFTHLRAIVTLGHERSAFLNELR